MFVISIAFAVLHAMGRHPDWLMLLAMPVAIGTGIMVHRAIELPLARRTAHIGGPARLSRERNPALG